MKAPPGWHYHKNGGGLVHDRAYAAPSAYVGKYAKVYGDSKVLDKARLTGQARVYGDARVMNRARISGNALIHGNAEVYGCAKISGNAEVYGDSKCYGRAEISGHAWIYGDTRIFGRAKVSGDCKLNGDIRVGGATKIFGASRMNGGTWYATPLQLQGTMHWVNMSDIGWLRIGCQNKTVEEWLDIFEDVGEKKKYTQEQIEEYEEYMELAAMLFATASYETKRL